MPSFIETQFPVSRLSKESYKERKANYSQTLTGLGKWWGRKPLILCRATILGLLLPATENPQRDREIFLKLLTMDDEGLLQRWRKRFKVAELAMLATTAEKRRWEALDDALESAKALVQERRLESRGIERGNRDAKAVAMAAIAEAVQEVERRAEELQLFLDELQQAVFLRQPYEEQIARCDRPEQIEGPSPAAWEAINAHLETSASNLLELVQELGQRTFGRTPRVGDAFCGGGSIPFEAARIGCDAYGSDLNPVAALLTWAALNIVGGGEKVAAQVKDAQQQVYDVVDRQVTAWGIEHRTEDVGITRWTKLVKAMEKGDLTPEEIHHEVPRADAYLYCVEVRCPETGWMVPLAPSWVIGEKSRCVATLEPDRTAKRYEIRIESGVSDEAMAAAREGTVQGGYIVHPILREMGRDPASIDQVRFAGRGKVAGAQYHENGLRLWENEDLVPRAGDVYQERLYCVRWVECYERENARGEIVWAERKVYRAPVAEDLEREAMALALLQERFSEWQREGFIPSMVIEPGYNTNQPIRERGWTQWHHLFNPRQLLINGAINSQASIAVGSKEMKTLLTLRVGRCADYNSKLSQWDSDKTTELVNHVFANQALNTLSDYGSRSLLALSDCVNFHFPMTADCERFTTTNQDARGKGPECDMWITDPPYADSVNYDELSDFFLVWYQGLLKREFPNINPNNLRALAVTGSEDAFKTSMIQCYRVLGESSPPNGVQVVMFTHQDAAIWAELTLILWASGLQVCNAWCVVTETDSARKDKGNYVQGTVLLILRKQSSNTTAFLDEVYPEVEAEVRRQLDAMKDWDEPHASSPDFSDTDYQLAAYAAALRVLTQYARIEDIDVERELSRQRTRGEKGELEKLIDQAVRIACDHLVPAGFDRHIWKILTPSERFYLKGLDLESHGEFRSGAYMELARGFGLRDYRELLGSGRANEVRLKTPEEFGRRLLGSGDGASGFGTTLTRQALFAIREVMQADGEAASGRNWLKNEVPGYWQHRQTLLEILRYLARLEHAIPGWKAEAPHAHTLAGAVSNDHA